MGVSVCAHEMGNARYLRSCVPLISWWLCRNFSTHAHFFHITSCCLIWSWSNFAMSQREREACCHANVTRKQRRSDEMRLINSDSYNWIVEYFTVQMTSDEGDCHIFLKIDSTCCCSAHFLFLPRQLSLFWHISDSCHRFNCIRRWQVYSLRGGVWCPQVNVPRRGHVGTI